MAKIQQNDPGSQGSGSDNMHVFTAGAQKEITLPNGEFLTDADIVRDGQDLVLQGPGGETVKVEGYFSAESAPLLTTPEGAHLTPALVDSFVRYDSPTQYAKAPSLNDASPVGLVKEVSGQATVTHTDGTSENITVGTPVFQGDIVETNGESAVNIRFIDESSFAVSNNARLAIDEYVFDPGNAGGASNFSLLRGVFVFTSGLIGRDDPDDVHINTPVGSIGIRGTTIIGTINPDGESQITVTEGAIVIKNGAGEQTLAQHNDSVTLAGYNDPVQYSGQISNEQMAQDYNVLRVVSPESFLGQGTETSTPSPDSDASAGDNENEELQTSPAPTGTSEEQTIFSELSATDSFSGDTNTFKDTTSTADNTLLAADTNTAGAIISGTTAAATSTTIISASATNTTSQLASPTTLTNTTGSTVISSGNNAFDLLAAGAPGIQRINGVFGSGERLGEAISFWGDRTGDGLEDFLIANDRATGGQIFNFSGVKTALNGVPGNPTSAPRISGIGDFDGDGQIDYVAGTPASNVPAANSGSATIFGSTDIVSLSGMVTGDQVGSNVAGIGDINGDGYSDVIIGAPGTGASDAGAAYITYGGTTNPSVNVGAMSTDGFAINGIAAGDRFGSEVSAAGDFNGDGFADFAMTEPGQGRVQVAFGGAGITGLTLGTNTLQINGIVADPLKQEIPVRYVGDFNGDGLSDIMLGATGANGGRGDAYIIYGNTGYAGGAAIDVTALSASQGFKIGITDPASKLDGGGAAGDFNGDGLDDIAVVLRTGSIADIYVVYGRATTGNLTDVDLDNPVNAFHMSYNVGSNAQFKFSIASAGDRNGDGKDDLVIGTPDANAGDGGFVVVLGRDENNLLNTSGVATTNGDHLIGTAGNDAFSTNAQGNVRINAGAGNDLLVVDNTALGGIDGGTGFDTLQLTGAGRTLDFTSLSTNAALRGSEALSGIEKFVMMDTSQTIKLGLDDIFSLLQQSSDNKLRIVESGGGGNFTNLIINDNGAGSGSFSTLAPGLGFTATGTDTTSDPGTAYNVYNFGSGYQLLIDQNINTVNVV